LTQLRVRVLALALVAEPELAQVLAREPQ